MFRAGKFPHGILVALIIATLVHVCLIWGFKVEPPHRGHSGRKSLSITLVKPPPAPVVAPPTPVPQIPETMGPPAPPVVAHSEPEAKPRDTIVTPTVGEEQRKSSETADVGPPAPPLGNRFVGPSKPVFVGPSKPLPVEPMGPPAPSLKSLREPRQPIPPASNTSLKAQDKPVTQARKRQPKPVISSRSTAADPNQAGHVVSQEPTRRPLSPDESGPPPHPSPPIPPVATGAGLVVKPLRPPPVREDDDDEVDDEDMTVSAPPVKGANQKPASKSDRMPSYVVLDPPRPPVVSGFYPPGGKPILPSRDTQSLTQPVVHPPAEPGATPPTMASNMSGQTGVVKPSSLESDYVPEKNPSPPAVKRAVETVHPKVVEKRVETVKAPKQPTPRPKRDDGPKPPRLKAKAKALDAPDKITRTHAAEKSHKDKPQHASNHAGHGDRGGAATGEGRKPGFSAGLLSQQIAEVGDDMFRQRNSELRDTKIVYATEMTSSRLVVTAYEQAWQDKVERIGNLNFPDEARRNKLAGKLVLAVGIKPDGSVYSIRVLQSSGHSVLDNAARSIVNLSAPFAPLPDEISRNVDVLVIKRTWLFDSDYHLETMSK